MKNNLRNILRGIVFSLASLSIPNNSEAKFEMTHPTTPVVEYYYSENSDVKKGDYIGVFVQGEEKEICIGKEKIEEDGFYGILPSYGNDTTTNFKDGAKCGDVLKFRIWNSKKKKYYPAITNPQEIIYGENKFSEVDVFPRKYNLEDLVKFAENWLEECNNDNNLCNYFGRENEILNLNDFSRFSEDYSPCSNTLLDFANYWLEECNFENNYCDCLGRPNEILNLEDFARFSKNYLE